MIMRLQKRLSRKIGNKEYNKYILTIPPKTINELGWKEGQELKITVKGKKATIEPE
jgi:bifunctional DNA-binding transcriptional regulator/antitoxin component of YhaV-PrlF toxin-antitoxin module